MIKGRSTTNWDNLNDIKVIGIPKPIESRNQFLDETQEIWNKTPIISIAMILILFTGWITYTLRNNLFVAWNIILGAFILVSLIYLIMRNRIKRPTIVISKAGVSLKSKNIPWEEVSNMYVEQEYTGEDYSFTLIIKRDNKSTKSIGLKWLSKEPETIIKEIGNYYWTWHESNK